ncbi:hypothetical protein KR044_004179, partial [Drosophila immigrans]
EASMLRFTNLVCHSGNISLYTLHTCRLKALQRNKIALYLNATLNYRTNHVFLNFQLVKKANGYKPWLYNYSLDCCDYLRRRNNPVLNIISNILKEYSNFIHPCPFEGTQLITGLYLTPSTIPVPLPSGEYGILVTFTFDNDVNVILNAYFEFIEGI